MAIINNKVKAFKDDRNENVFIGIDLPFQKSDKNDGWFKSTTTTFEAITNNVKSLLNTQKVFPVLSGSRRRFWAVLGRSWVVFGVVLGVLSWCHILWWWPNSGIYMSPRNY